jgi:hypothetical protein
MLARLLIDGHRDGLSRPIEVGAASGGGADHRDIEAARILHDRVQIDPFVMWVWGATTILVFGIVYVYILR